MVRLVLSILAACALSVLGQDPGRGPRQDPGGRELLAQEKRSPTTAQNARRRYRDLVRFIHSSGRPDRYLPFETAGRIEALLDGGRQEEAAPLVHAAILGLGKAGTEAGEEGAGFRRREAWSRGRGGMRALERLVAAEKETATTADNVLQQHRAFLRAVLDTEVPQRYIPSGKMASVDDLLGQGQLEAAAVRLHQVILAAGEALGSGAVSRTPSRAVPLLREAPQASEGAEEAPPSVLPTGDQGGATALYFKAMQAYADGKLERALSLLQSASKLDPSNQDVAKALERLRKERP